TTVDQTNGFDATQTGNPSMWTVDLAQQQFVPIANTNTNTLSAGTPYLMFIRGDRSINLDNPVVESDQTTLRATGMLHKGDRTQNFTTTALGEFAMFGNPYQSAVDVNAVFAQSTNVNPNHYYVYDPGHGTQGGYVTVQLPAGNNGQMSPANQYLQPGQGAQFQTAAAGASAIKFTENAKAPGNHTTTNINGNGFNERNMINVMLFAENNYENGKRPHDGFTLMFDPTYSNAITLVDATKPMNFRENMAIDNNGNLLSIEKREMPVATEVYQLYTSGYSFSSYTLKIDVTGLENNIFYLDDIYTGNSTLLAAGETLVNFQIDSNEESRATSRFSIRVENRLGVEDHALAGIRLFPNPLNAETFYIHAPKLNGEQVEVSIADMAGRQIFNSNLDCSSNKITVNVNDTLASGVYPVTLKFEGEAQTYRLIRE